MVDNGEIRPGDLNPLGTFDINQGLAPELVVTFAEAELAEQFMIVAMKTCTPDGKLAAYQLPACVAIRCARLALQRGKTNGDSQAPA